MAANTRSRDEERRKAVYRKIGFLQHIQDDFLNNLHCHKIQHFRRGEIINQQETLSEWIYIVIQGSVSVLKRVNGTSESVQLLRVKRNPGKNMGIRIDQELVPLDKEHDKGSFNRQLTIYQSTYQAEKRLEQTLPGYLSYSDRLGTLPYDSIIQQHKQRVFRKAAGVLPEIVINDVTPRDLSRQPDYQRLPPIKRNTKGLYLSVSRVRRHDDQQTDGTIVKRQLRRKTKTKGSRQKRIEDKETGEDITSGSHNNNDKVPSQSSYILLTVLEKGEYFGLDEILFKNQARCSLVSNGAVCGLISKRSFLQQSDEDTIYNLRMSENPHPSTPMLRHKLQNEVKWEKYRTRIYNRLAYSKDRNNRLKAQFHPQFLGEYCFRTGPR